MEGTMTELTKVPELASGERPETGPMQFGDDWPGLFIRGDNALMGFAPAVYRAIQTLPESEWMTRAQLSGLLETLKSCAAQNFR
jgi:hypothetical protein